MVIATRFEWPSAAAAAKNDRTIVKKAKAAVAAFEAEYGMSSADMKGKLQDGSLQESEAICRWLIALDMLASVGRGKPA
jgi:hypothetical protein